MAKKAVGKFDTEEADEWQECRKKAHEALSYMVEQVHKNAPAEMTNLKDSRKKGHGQHPECS